jgi:hypothetical protein
MFFFGIRRPDFGLKKGKAPSKEDIAVFAQGGAVPPTRKPVCVVHPENASRMIRDDGFPKDFSLYEYAGATLEVLSGKGSDGKILRRPALVAKMVRRYKLDDAFVEVEMTASIRDLRKAAHPHASSIAAALMMFYDEKVSRKEPVLNPQRVASAASTLSKFPANDFFAKMNSIESVPTWIG